MISDPLLFLAPGNFLYCLVHSEMYFFKNFIINYLEFVHFKATELFSWAAIVLEVCDFVVFISRFYVGCLAHVFGLFFSYLWIKKKYKSHTLCIVSLSLSSKYFVIQRSFLSSSALLV